MTGYDYLYCGYPLPFYDYCLDSKQKDLLYFRFYGASGMLQSYVLRRNGQLYLKADPVNFSGYYVFDNPLLEYTCRFKNGKLQTVTYVIKSDPTLFGIDRFRSRFMEQTQLIDNLSQECLRLSQHTIEQLMKLKKVTYERGVLDAIEDLTNTNFKMIGELPYARNITLYDLVLLAKAVGAKINITVDDVKQDRQIARTVDSLFVEVQHERDEREKLRQRFISVMRVLELFFSNYNQLKYKNDVHLDPQVKGEVDKLYRQLVKHVPDYRRSQKKLTIS